jgi:transposase
MGLVSKLLDEAVVEGAKKELKSIGNNRYVARKLEAVIAAKKHGITHVAAVYDISPTTLTAWIKHIKQGRINKLYAPPERRRKSKLNDNQRQEIAAWIKDNSQLTIKAIRLKIEEKFGIKVSKSTVHREIKKNCIAPI